VRCPPGAVRRSHYDEVIAALGCLLTVRNGRLAPWHRSLDESLLVAKPATTYACGSATGCKPRPSAVAATPIAGPANKRPARISETSSTPRPVRCHWSTSPAGGCPRDLRPRTRELYGHLLARRIAPTFGAEPINRITTEAVRSWHATATSDISALQAAKAYRLLRAILNTAVADGLLASNPCCIPGAGQERSPERPLAEPADVLRLSQTIEPRFEALVLLAAVGGLRVGELLGLQRRHVDLAEATVRVEHQAIELFDSTRIISAPKTDAGRRTIAIPEFVVVAMAGHLERFTADGGDA
jgi:hypothetical protein